MNKIKMFVVALMISVATSVSATTKADTIAVDNSQITKVIADSVVNTKGNKVVKYYFIYKGELIVTSKTVIEKYNLCKRYGARLAMVIVRRGNNKRIVLN